MGKLMAASADDLLPTTDQRGEVLVDNKETGKQGLPVAPGRAYGMSWTRILAEEGLESPGYQETIQRMRKEGRIKGY